MLYISLVGEPVFATVPLRLPFRQTAVFQTVEGMTNYPFAATWLKKEKKGSPLVITKAAFSVLELAAFARALEIDQCRRSAHFVNTNSRTFRQ